MGNGVRVGLARLCIGSTALTPTRPSDPVVRALADPEDSFFVGSLAYSTMPAVLSAEQSQVALASLQPELRTVLEDLEVPKELRARLGHHRIRTIRTLAGLGSSEDNVRSLLIKEFEMDESSLADRVDCSLVVAAWDVARTRICRELQADEDARIEGRPRDLPKQQQKSLRESLEEMYGGKPISKELYPSRDYLQWRLAQAEDDDYEAEKLDEVISEKEGTKLPQDLTVSMVPTHIRFSRPKSRISMPQDTEELRMRYKTMSFCWSLVRLKYPERPNLAGLSYDIFSDLLDYLLGDEVMKFRGPMGQHVSWKAVLDYEFAIREQALEWTKRRHGTIAEMLRKAMADPKLHTTHFITILSLENTPKGGGGGQKRPPPANPSAPASSSADAWPEPPAKKGKGKGKQAKQKAGGKKGGTKGGKGQNETTPESRAVNKAKVSERLQTTVDGIGICIRYNKGRCDTADCRFLHNCLRCGKAGHILMSCRAAPTPL